MIDLWKYAYENVRIITTAGEVIEGYAISVLDAEDTDDNETSITIENQKYKPPYRGVFESEIKEISTVA